MSRALSFNYVSAGDDEYDSDDFETIQDGIRAMFLNDVLPYVVKQYGHDDEVAICEAFNDWTDALCKDGLISDYVYDKITLEDDE